MNRTNGLLYRDPKYGFYLRIPRWWKSYIAVKREERLMDAEYGVQFLFKYKGKQYGDVLTMLVYRMSRKQWRDQGYEDSPVVFLAERNGLIYAYTLPEELPDAFLDKDGQDYDYKKYGIPIRLMKRMVNHDVPILIKTFRLTGSCTIKARRTTRHAPPSTPLRSSKIWPYRP